MNIMNSWLDKFLLKYWPNLAFRRAAKKLNIQNTVFSRLDEVFCASKRIDVIPTAGLRGFVFAIDQETAFYFYQIGDHFEYDGFEMGPYGKGDVTIFDNLRNK